MVVAPLAGAMSAGCHVPTGLLVAMTWEPEIMLASIVLADRL